MGCISPLGEWFLPTSVVTGMCCICVQKNEIVAWVHEGGGFLVEDVLNKKVDYIIERHGSRADTASCSSHATFVSSH